MLEFLPEVKLYRCPFCSQFIEGWRDEARMADVFRHGVADLSISDQERLTDADKDIINQYIRSWLLQLHNLVEGKPGTRPIPALQSHVTIIIRHERLGVRVETEEQGRD